jgi:DNA-directed RNA polymerase subunit M/transcription elongation factor TFIIS
MSTILVPWEAETELPLTNLESYFYSNKSLVDITSSYITVYNGQKAQLYKVIESYNPECPKCGKNNTTFAMAQFRSNDEGQEGILTCIDCVFSVKMVISEIKT